MLIPDNFFEYIYHVGCAINSHSIINSGLTPGGENLSRERQTVFFLPVNPMDKEHKDPDTIDLGTPRLARYMHTAWKKHENTVFWVDIKLAQNKGFKFYQTRSNAIILYDTLPAYCIPKAVRMETGEIIYEKVFESLQPPPKISLRNDCCYKDNWMKELDSEVAGGEDSQQIQPKSKTQLSRTGRPVSEQPSGLLTQEIRKDVLFGRESTNSRTVRPVDGAPSCQSCMPVSVGRVDKDEDADENVDAEQTRTGRTVSGQPTVSFTQFEEIDIDFRVSGLPHAVVKLPRSRAREEDRKSSSPRSTSSRLAAK